MIINDCGLRGGNYNNNTNAGVFNFNPSTNAIGGANNNNSFRLVMGLWYEKYLSYYRYNKK